MKTLRISLVVLVILIAAAIFMPAEKAEAAFDFTIDYQGDKLILSDFKKNEISENVRYWAYDYSTVKEIIIKNSTLHYEISWFGAVHHSNDLAYILSAMPNIEVFRFEDVTFRDDIDTYMPWFPAFAFQYNQKIREFHFTENHINISHNVFRGCPNLTSVNIWMKEHISDYAFDGCQKLSNVNIYPIWTDGVSIGKYAFANCPSLTSIAIDKVTSVGWGAFERCASLESVSLPAAVTVADYAFYMCPSLKSVHLPNATFIGPYAFANNPMLHYAYIPKLQKVSYASFENCERLPSIDFPLAQSVEAYAFKNCVQLTKVKLPKATHFDNEAFRGCMFLHTIELPKAEYFGWGAFEDCSFFTNLLLGATPPFAQPSAFNSTYPHKSIFVPTNSLSAYDSAVYPGDDGLWNGFSVKPIQTGNEITEVIFTEFDPFIYAYPEPGSNEIIAWVPYGTDWNLVKSLEPAIRTSYMATTDPPLGVVQDLTKPVQYTVTSQSGSSRNYLIIVKEIPNTENDILSFDVNNYDAPVIGVIDQDKNTVNLTIPFYEDITAVSPAISISTDASVSPGSGVYQDFTNPVIYTVTAQNGNPKEYLVTVTKEADPMNGIKSFTFDGLYPIAEGLIDDPEQEIIFILPFGTEVSNLSPTIQISEGATISPASDIPQDFTSPVIYTVTSHDGVSRTYTVRAESGDRIGSQLRISSFYTGSLPDFMSALNPNPGDINHLTITGGQLSISDWDFLKSSYKHLMVIELIDEARLYSDYLNWNMFSTGTSLFTSHYYFYNLHTLRVHNITAVGSCALAQYSYLHTFEGPDVITIYDNAFLFCNDLRQINIPSIQYVYQDAFTYCTSLNLMFLGSTVPNAYPGVFNTLPSERYVYVPSAAVQDYKAYSDGNTADDLWFGWKISTPVEITGFSFNGFDVPVNGVINSVSHQISVTVPYGTDTTALIPSIILSDTAVLTPLSGVPQDFSVPFTYTVTDSNGIDNIYTVTVEVALNHENDITAFSLPGLTPVVTGMIDDSTSTIELTVPYGTDVTALVPSITVSEEASVSPAAGLSQNFTAPVIYTVTAQNSDTQDYVVTVKLAPNTEKEILGFDLSEPAATGVIDDAAKTVELIVPFETDVTSLVPVITLSAEATVSPGSGMGVDFIDPVIYTVTAQDGSAQDYTVTVTRENPDLSADDFVWVSGWEISQAVVLERSSAVSNGEIVITDWGGMDITAPIQNDYVITLRAGDSRAYTDLTITVSVKDATGDGGYNIEPVEDGSCLTAIVDGVPTLTVLKGVKKTTLSITVDISCVLGHDGTETIVFEHYKGGKKLVGTYMFTDDFDGGTTVTVDFDVKQKDVIKIYIIAPSDGDTDIPPEIL